MNAIGAVRLALGGVLVARPEQVAALAGAQPSGTALSTVRVLGGRYLLQGAVDVSVHHDPRLDAGVEAVHAASMLVLARRSPAHARLAVLSAGVALGLAVADLRRRRP